MLKFFRKYNRIILVVGVVVLMAAFGIGPAIQSFMPGPGERAVGTIDGEEITFNQRGQAQQEMIYVLRLLRARFGTQLRTIQALQQPRARMFMNMRLQRTLQDRNLSLQQPRMLVPEYLASRYGADQPPAALAWFLARRDAKQIGLSVSPQEVNQAFSKLGFKPEFAADQLDTTTDAVRQAVRHWLMIEQYATVMAGTAFDNLSVNSAQPGLAYLDALGEMSKGEKRQQQARNMIQAIETLAHAQRVSEPMAQHYLQQQQAQVGGQLLLIDSNPRRDQIDPPSEKRIKSIFNEYKDDLPGTGEPYQIGYKYPDRVKLEALVLPMDRVRQSIEVTSEEVWEHYENNESQYKPDQGDEDEAASDTANENADNDNADSADGDDTQGQESDEAENTAESEPKTDAQIISENYDQIESDVRDQQARDKAREILNKASSMMQQPLRTIATSGGYREMPNDFEQFLKEHPNKAKKLKLETVKSAIQDQYDIELNIERFTDNWHPVSELSALPEIGQAGLPNQQRGGALADYVGTARTFDPPTTNALTALRLQVGVPSEQLQMPAFGEPQARLIVRLTAAQASHEPESLAEVRDRVEEHAEEIAAFEALMNDRETLLDQARTNGLANVAKSENGQMQSFGPTRRRMRGQPPRLPGVGQHAALIDAIFNLATSLKPEKNQSVGDLPRKKRIGSMGLEAKRSLALYQVDSFQPVPRNRYQAMLSNHKLAPSATQWVQGRQPAPEPLSLEALKRRTGFKMAGEDETQSESENDVASAEQ